MNIRTRFPRAGPTLLGLALLGACVDQPMEPPIIEPRPVLGATILCTADVRADTVACGQGAPVTNAAFSILVGGYGERVRLLPSRVGFNPDTRTLHAWMAVQNLLAQPMGTPDGATVTGLRVFFPSSPVPTMGTGAVTVLNPDGTADISARRQPYFAYNQIVAPESASASREWAFRVADGVEAFEFQVLVETVLPVEDGVLRWVSRAEVEWRIGSSILRMFSPGGSTVFALRHYSRPGHSGPPVSGSVLVSTDGGAAWTLSPVLDRVGLEDLWAPDASTVYAIGDEWDGGTGRVFRATRDSLWQGWTLVHAESDRRTRFAAMWGSGAQDVYIVGGVQEPSGWQPLILRSADGRHWTRSSPAAAAGRNLVAIWGSGPNDVYVIASGGDDNLVLHSSDRGENWTARSVPPGLSRVWGLDAGHVWALGNGGGAEPGGFLLYSTDGGTSWERTDFPGVGLRGMRALSPTDVYVAGYYLADTRGAILRKTGTAWHNLWGNSWAVFFDVWGTGPDNLVAGGTSLYQGVR